MIRASPRCTPRLSGFGSGPTALTNARRPSASRNQAERVLDMLEASEKPLIVAGGGIINADAADLLIERGAASVWCMATHGLFSGPAVDRLKNSKIDKVVITNTLPLPSEKQFDKVEVLSVAPIIADAIRAVFEDTSVSEIFDGENLS